MIKYRTESTAYRAQAVITPVTVEKETVASVWILGRKCAKRSDHAVYHDTWEAAHAHLMEAAEDHCQHARRRLQEANSYLGNVKGMKKPEAL